MLVRKLVNKNKCLVREIYIGTVKPPTGGVQLSTGTFKKIMGNCGALVIAFVWERGLSTQMGSFTLPIYSNDPQAIYNTLTMIGDNFFTEILKHCDDNGDSGWWQKECVANCEWLKWIEYFLILLPMTEM